MGASVLIAHSDAHAASLNGSASLNGCSGSLVRFEGQPDDDLALVLTNGHCISFLGSYQVLTDIPFATGMRFYNVDEALTPVFSSTRIVYATMHETDVALLELDTTYRELQENEGVDALVLAQQRGQIGEEIAVVSGFWEYITECAIDDFVPTLAEDAWTWNDSIRYTEACDTFGGTSGSPIISQDTGLVVGVNNTGFENTSKPCAINNPCEIDENGEITALLESSYGQQVDGFYTCIDENFIFDLDLESCVLPRPVAEIQVDEFSTRVRHHQSCDGDNILDAGEGGILSMQIRNFGDAPLDDAEIEVTASSSAVRWPMGNTFPIRPVESARSVRVRIPIGLDASISEADAIEFSVVVRSNKTVEPEFTTTFAQQVHYDTSPDGVSFDDVESDASVWSPDAPPDLPRSQQWTRDLSASGMAWHVSSPAQSTTQCLESPPFIVDDGSQPFLVTASHRYSFETAIGQSWDGGVVEVSTDGGQSWVDATQIGATLDYPGTITTLTPHPYLGRDAFVGDSPGWPDTSPLVIDFGDNLATEIVQLRFCVGTDSTISTFGWEIDDISVEGIRNAPFAALEANATTCP